MPPALILLIGMATILGAILLLRLNAFLALIIAAIVVSLLAPGEPAVKIARVAEGFGRTAGTVGIVIALAAITGKAMMDSGAADRIVNGFLALLGEKRGATALCATGYVLSIPVFFDTVFYLLVPLARTMHGRTNRNYLKYLLAITAGAGATHTLVPPTPGPLAIAGTLGVDLGTMVLVGIVVALPAAGVGLLLAGWVDRRMPVVPRAPTASALDASAAAAPQPLPDLVPSLLPIILPVLLISSHTVVVSMTARPGMHLAMWSALAPYTAIIGNPNLALLVAAAVAMGVYARQRGVSRAELAEMVETSLMSAGVMILIIAASGAFGVALQATEIGPVIERAFVGQSGAAASGTGSGLIFLFLGFGVASLIKIAQGSSTVAMITTAAMLAAMLPANGGGLPFHTVYVATAIASGSLVGTWMNDSGFWLFSKMGGVTEIETLKSWTPVLAVVGVTGMVTTLVDTRRNDMVLLGMTSGGSMPDDMGSFRVDIEIENPARPGERRTLRSVLVDTGAELSWVPAELLESLRVERNNKWRFRQADGTILERWTGGVSVYVAGKRAADEVVFGQPGDLVLLGSRTLEGLNFRIEPVTKQLVDAGPAPAAAAA